MTGRSGDGQNRRAWPWVAGALVLLCCCCCPVSSQLSYMAGENLVTCAGRGDAKGVAFWVGFGVDVNSKTDEGTTAVQAAAGSGQYHIVEYLLSHGADPWIRDSNGQNAFDVARDFKSKEILSKWLHEHEFAAAP
ncbi:MAG: ankyrin repeat domain-containing protein [Fimbriimonadaceae bacterium]|nr:ankyrin repeat domain-containing protein [Fimbriimonadaceae bacterium]MCZ7580704.1 ankyrin repeat domain-containing protein [Fimbriimonadaceae bacterium]QOJ12634.1 MAG: ankyrin repeat domain-containing protein [Chthonomonadaceae bacterium]